MENKVHELIRHLHKSSDGEFLYELEHAFELSPKLSEQILITAKECLLRENILGEGQIEVSVIGIEERSGKVLEQLEKCKVILTIDAGQADIEALKLYGRIGLRRIKIQRITDEAVEQGGVLSQEDIGKYLSCTKRTVQRDIREIKKSGIEVITRGVLHNIGRGQTHKVKIIGMYLDGKTYSEIKLSTRHSVGAIKRYIESFSKVLMCHKSKIYGRKAIGVVTGLSEGLVKQYQDLIRESRKDPIRSSNLNYLETRNSYRGPLKKRECAFSSNHPEALTGGF
jgi:DNA-binding Lrp family transcriptional regulator